MEIIIQKNLLSLEKLICLCRKRRYEIKSLTCKTTEDNFILDIEFQDITHEILQQRIKQINKLLEVMK